MTVSLSYGHGEQSQRVIEPPALLLVCRAEDCQDSRGYRGLNMCTCQGLAVTEASTELKALFDAEGDPEQFEVLLRQHPHLQDMPHPATGWSPLMVACRKGYSGVAELLVSRGASISRFTCRWGAAMSIASHWGHERLVSLLIRHGADPTCYSGTVAPPLIIAAKEGHTGVMSVLLDEGGVDVDATDLIGRTALSHAASRGMEPVVRFLLARGAVTGIRDVGGLTAAGRARQTRNGGCAELIEVGGRQSARVWTRPPCLSLCCGLTIIMSMT